MLISITWVSIVIIATLIFYLILSRKRKLSTTETIGLPRGYFRIVILITFLGLSMYEVSINRFSDIKDVMIVIVTFYFGTHIVNKIKE